MVSVKFEHQEYSLEQKQTVLDVLLDAGVDISYGCKSGACQSCMMEMVSGNVPKESQKMLKDSWQARNYFLACQCIPTEDINVAKIDNHAIKLPAKVIEKCMLNENVIQLKLKVDDGVDFTYFPGQYMTLWAGTELKRCYSLASVYSEDDYLEFQIKHVTDGAFSHWVYASLMEGDTLFIQGPMGDCFYTADRFDEPLILVGIGTGQSPLKGIVREALRQGHKGEIYFYSGVSSVEGLYDQDFFRALEKTHKNFTYKTCALNKPKEGDDGADALSWVGDINELIQSEHSSFKDFRAFLCGSEQRVKKLRKLIFLGGANMKDIYADVFVAT